MPSNRLTNPYGYVLSAPLSVEIEPFAVLIPPVHAADPIRWIFWQEYQDNPKLPRDAGCVSGEGWTTTVRMIGRYG